MLLRSEETKLATLSLLLYLPGKCLKYSEGLSTGTSVIHSTDVTVATLVLEHH